MRVLASVLALGIAMSTGLALAAGETAHPPDADFGFKKPFGQFDRGAVRRGFTVYRTLCSACHGLRHVAWRNLADVGFSEEEIAALAAATEVRDGPNEEGKMFLRPGRPSDRFPDPFPNARAAAFVNGGVAPPDLSLMVQARADGANYVYALLTGYGEQPEGFELRSGSYNRYFPGGAIAMPQPLWGDDIEFADGTPATLEQEARDVVTFLAWTADPYLEKRKRTGFKVLLFLVVMTAIFYGSYRKIWRRVRTGEA